MKKHIFKTPDCSVIVSCFTGIY